MGLVHLLVSGIAAHLADGVLKHHILLEEVVDGNLILGVVVHRTLEEETQEALRAPAAGTACQILAASRTCSDTTPSRRKTIRFCILRRR